MYHASMGLSRIGLNGFSWACKPHMCIPWSMLTYSEPKTSVYWPSPTNLSQRLLLGFEVGIVTADAPAQSQ